MHVENILRPQPGASNAPYGFGYGRSPVQQMHPTALFSVLCSLFFVLCSLFSVLRPPVLSSPVLQFSVLQFSVLLRLTRLHPTAILRSANGDDGDE
jgi:hypothetical protein